MLPLSLPYGGQADALQFLKYEGLEDAEGLLLLVCPKGGQADVYQHLEHGDLEDADAGEEEEEKVTAHKLLTCNFPQVASSHLHMLLKLYVDSQPAELCDQLTIRSYVIPI